jgi:tetratricopeptide (TPR) repeat protein
LEAASRRGDVQAQRLALTDMFKTASVPTLQATRLRYMAALYSFHVGNYDDTLAQLAYARTLGYTGIDALMLTADTHMRRGKPKEARPIVEQVLAQQRASGQAIPAAWYDKAISLAYQAGDWPQVGALYRERLAVYPSTANWRSAISNYLATPSLDADVQLDLYRLQAAVGAMASERDYQAYATLAERNGHNAEAKAIIEAGRAAGKLQPTQAVTAALMKTVAPKAAKDIAALPAQARKAASDSSGKAAMAAADAYFSLGQFPQAVEQYRAALAKGSVDTAQAYSRLGVSLARSGDLPGARAALAQAGGEWRNVAAFWSVWVDQLGKQGG